MPFTNDRPDKDLGRNFMRHNKLSTKKANIISSTQKSSTLNPFLIHDFYDAIKEIITTKKLGSLQIWNAGETGFPIDPQKLKVIAPVGEVCFTSTEKQRLYKSNWLRKSNRIRCL